ncbi:MAG: hypothetical protein QM300_05440 [Pseudomonadota bacterium]|jgi:hypothetical protein|nr:hypothetical protein [Pseudomonadota bacterium]
MEILLIIAVIAMVFWKAEIIDPRKDEGFYSSHRNQFREYPHSISNVENPRNFPAVDG